MVDVVCAAMPPPDSRIHADVSFRAGGSAVSAAEAAVAAGAAATVIGRIGDDPLGDLIAASLTDRGIDGLLARDSELPTGAAVALTSALSSVSIVAQRGANAQLSTTDIPETVDADALLVSGFVLFQTGSEDAGRAALERFTGAWAGVDMASPELAGLAKADLDQAMSGANVILATADEAHALTGARPEEAARTMGSRFAIACIKLGEQGAILVHRNGIERHVIEPVTRSSPFGAGDAFGGTLLVALAQGKSPAQALEIACEAGARVDGSPPL